MLTLSKVVVEVGNRADAARAGDYRLELEAAPEAYARTDYQLAEQGLEKRSERASSSLWLGADDALAQFGVRRGQPIEREDLITALQGRHVQTGEQLRRQSALIVHGPNSDVDLVNELAQQKRLEAGELGEQAVPAVDRDYLLRAGDVVAIRNAAYTFPAHPDGPRPKRVENGQVAVVDAVDPDRDTLRLLLREPGAQPRLVEIDQAHLRAQRAAGERTAAVRLGYAMHSFPAQGATVQGTATLAGHWSQAKRETYVGDTRAVYRQSVHVAREDLGVQGTDQDRVARYAQRIAENRQRLASIRSALDRTLQLTADLPTRAPIPGLPALPAGQRDTSPVDAPAPANASSDTSRGVAAPPRETSPSAAGTPPASPPRQQPDEPSGPPAWLIKQLGPPPEDRIARERWEREAQRRKGLQRGSQPRPSRSRPSPPPPPSRRSGPSPPRQSPPKPGGPTIGR